MVKKCQRLYCLTIEQKIMIRNLLLQQKSNSIFFVLLISYLFLKAALAAASFAIGTLKGEQLT